MASNIIHAKLVIALLVVVLLQPAPSAKPTTDLISKPGCVDYCGNTSIPFPFGMEAGCYQDEKFAVLCNDTFNPPKPFINDSNIEITGISTDGQMHVLRFIARDCYDSEGNTTDYNEPRWKLLDFTINSTANKFIAVGCDTYARLEGYYGDNHNYTTGCISSCGTIGDITNGSCSGVGCCQVSLPQGLWNTTIIVDSYNQYTNVQDVHPCSYGFVIENGTFVFSSNNLTDPWDGIEKLPMVADWVIGNETCEEARKNLTTYACQDNTECHEPYSGGSGFFSGYRCSCKKGFKGHPYLANGCQDIDECNDTSLNNCTKGSCKNTIGDYYCSCPKGYTGDGREYGKGCNPKEKKKIEKIITGVALGISAILAVSGWLYLGCKKRRSITAKEKFFRENGGWILRQKLEAQVRSRNTSMFQIFCADDLKKATDNYDESRIIGQGGFGTVYKGYLPDDRTVAVKKSKVLDRSQIDQFVNELLVLSQINHKNIVKLKGCCLETEVPLLVYEFIDNGTLYEHIHHKAKASNLSWDIRLRIAAEIADALSYLHSAADPSIIHGDVKSVNILLDSDYTAKVSDFGTSRWVPLDQTQLFTMVQGTIGYLDPEYMQTSKLSEKSDVYSFGVVLLELLTAKKALSFDRPKEEISLANYFLASLRHGRLPEILDSDIVCDDNIEQLKEISKLASSCLSVKGEDRPSMKEVAMEFNTFRRSMTKHPLVHQDQGIHSEMGMSVFGQPTDSSTSEFGSTITTTVGSTITTTAGYSNSSYSQD